MSIEQDVTADELYGRWRAAMLAWQDYDVEEHFERAMRAMMEFLLVQEQYPPADLMAQQDEGSAHHLQRIHLLHYPASPLIPDLQHTDSVQSYLGRMAGRVEPMQQAFEEISEALHPQHQTGPVPPAQNIIEMLYSDLVSHMDYGTAGEIVYVVEGLNHELAAHDTEFLRITGEHTFSFVFRKARVMLRYTGRENPIQHMENLDVDPYVNRRQAIRPFEELHVSSIGYLNLSDTITDRMRNFIISLEIGTVDQIQRALSELDRVTGFPPRDIIEAYSSIVLNHRITLSRPPICGVPATSSIFDYFTVRRIIGIGPEEAQPFPEGNVDDADDQLEDDPQTENNRDDEVDEDERDDEDEDNTYDGTQEPRSEETPSDEEIRVGAGIFSRFCQALDTGRQTDIEDQLAIASGHIEDFNFYFVDQRNAESELSYVYRAFVFFLQAARVFERAPRMSVLPERDTVEAYVSRHRGGQPGDARIVDVGTVINRQQRTPILYDVNHIKQDMAVFEVPASNTGKLLIGIAFVQCGRTVVDTTRLGPLVFASIFRNALRTCIYEADVQQLYGKRIGRFVWEDLPALADMRSFRNACEYCGLLIKSVSVVTCFNVLDPEIFTEAPVRPQASPSLRRAAHTVQPDYYYSSFNQTPVIPRGESAY